MRTITINVSEPVYREFQEYASTQGRTASELIREAMAIYRDLRLAQHASVRDLQPLSLGRIKKPISRRADLLAEMLGDPRS